MDKNDVEITAGSNSSKLPVWVILLSFTLLLGILALVGWSLQHAHQDPVSIGQDAPDFQLTTFDGQQFNPSDVSGKIIVVNFWASWCAPCKDEAALLENAWQRLSPRGDILFLGIDYVDTEPEAREFLQTNQISYPNGADKGTRIADAFRIAGVPETFIINPDGKIAFIKIGPFLSADELIQIIDHLE
jgi:cytochrome c biogenesis protein CcmG/thiol:disulfide interchange protein DsbE